MRLCVVIHSRSLQACVAHSLIRVLHVCSVTGGELFERIVQVGVYSERQAAEIVANVLSALNYLHSCNILHRDIKPENILLASHDSAEIKLSDFGIAKVLEEEGEDARSRGRAYTSCGTDYYVGTYHSTRIAAAR